MTFLMLVWAAAALAAPLSAPAGPAAPPTVAPAPAPAPATAVAKAADYGAWKVNLTAASNSGAGSLMASVASSQALINIAGKTEPAAFIVSCSSRGLFVGVVWPDFISHEIGSDNAVVMKWSVDGQSEQSSHINANDRTAIVSGLTGLGMLERIAGGKTLSVHLSDQDGGQTATFPIIGAGAIYNTVVTDGCG